MDGILTVLQECSCLTKVYIDMAVGAIGQAADFVNKQLKGTEPVYIILATIVIYSYLVVITKTLYALYHQVTIGNVLKFLRGLPVMRRIYEQKLNKIGEQLKHDLMKIYNGEPFVDKLPEKGVADNSLKKLVDHYKKFDDPVWKNGRISGAVYVNDQKDYNSLLGDVYSSNMWSNPLHSDVFACVRRMEGEIVRMVGSMYNGDPKRVVGSVTSGGTESIVMACKAYRDYAINIRGVVGKPEIVAPVTAHAAFEKAANMLQCKIVLIPVNQKTFKVNMRKMKSAINKNTCMLVGSAPQFPHGIIDPIEDIAKLGLRYSVPVHVDACLGGFLIPFMSLAGIPLAERFDFSLAGVTSISADTHKYGYAPKGTSVIMYRERKYIHQQYSIQTDWPGGIYASPTLPGSRPGALIATCWVAMMHHGLAGYVDATKKIVLTTRKMEDRLRQVNGIKILGEPKVSVIALASDHFDIYELNDKLKQLGWNLNALQFPSAVHICVTLMHANDMVYKSFIEDVESCIKTLMDEASKAAAEGKKIKPTGSAAVYGMAQTLPDRSIVTDICTQYLDGCLGY